MLAASILLADHVEDHLHILGVGERHVGQLEALNEDLDVVTVLLALGEQARVQDPLHATQFEFGRSQTGS